MNKIGSDLSRKKMALIVSMLMMAAFCLRIWDIDMRVLHHDESLHAYYSWVLYKGDGYIHNPMMHGPFQFFLTAGLFKIFVLHLVSNKIDTIIKKNIIDTILIWLFIILIIIF